MAVKVPPVMLLPQPDTITMTAALTELVTVRPPTEL
jgi:hypothetical protein